MRLVLHAGTHKTGTTSIQRVLADNRDWLRGRGLYYPDGGRIFRTSTPHHEFAHGLSGIDPVRHRASLDYIRQIRWNAREGETVIISSEPIYRHISGRASGDNVSDEEYWARRRLYLEQVAHALHEFDVEVLLFYRRVDDFAVSSYGEAVRKGSWHGDFMDFIIQRNPRRYEYDAQFSLFRSTFQRLATRSYDDALSKGIVSVFFDTLGFPMPPVVTNEWLRPTQHPRLLLWMARRGKVTNVKDLRDFISSDEASQIFTDKVGFWPSESVRNDFLQRYGAKPACDPTLPEVRLSDEEAQLIDSKFDKWIAERRRSMTISPSWISSPIIECSPLPSLRRLGAKWKRFKHPS